jgi:hypothetical protein
VIGVLVTCRLYWGHWILPPSSASTVREFVSLDRFSSYRAVGLVSSGPAALRKEAASANRIAGENPFGRLAVAIKERGLSPTSTAAVPAELVARIQATLAEQLLEPTDERNPQPPWLNGDIATGRSENGDAIVAAALSTGSVSGDHYPYYEALLVNLPSGDLRLVRFRRYWFDVAGMEGIGHWFVGIVVAAVVLVGWALYGVMRLVVMIAMRIRCNCPLQRSAAARRR